MYMVVTYILFSVFGATVHEPMTDLIHLSESPHTAAMEQSADFAEPFSVSSRFHGWQDLDPWPDGSRCPSD